VDRDHRRGGNEGRAGARQRHPEIEWARIARMRHRLVHDYAAINYDIVWETAVRDLPILVAQLDRLLANWQDPAADPPR
jgi:uncharacterized protein with HEPN domain